MVSDTSKAEEKRGSPRRLIGAVVSSNRAKTIKVVTSTMHKHPLYHKYVRKRTVCHVHDESNEAGVGDTVEIMECRPISKTKHWRLVRVVTKSIARQVAGGAEG